ncbi:MAG: NADH-quinone oxidoreductase subunit NuoE [Spirochaetia bacterium]
MNSNDDIKLQQLKEYMQGFTKDPHAQSNLITVLHRAQELYGYLKQEVMEEIAYSLAVPTAKIWGVASFYHYFNLSPVGRHVISVCMGTACYVKGAGLLLERVRQKLNIDVGATSADGLFTLQEARCLGACGLAPVVMIDDRIYGKLSAEGVAAVLDSYANRYKNNKQQSVVRSK